jgi:hypothetical protein
MNLVCSIILYEIPNIPYAMHELSPEETRASLALIQVFQFLKSTCPWSPKGIVRSPDPPGYAHEISDTVWVNSHAWLSVYSPLNHTTASPNLSMHFLLYQ